MRYLVIGGWVSRGCFVVFQSVCYLDFGWVGYVGYFACTVFACLHVYLLLKKRFAFSGVCLALGVAAKLYPVLFLVPIAFYIYKSSGAGERLKNFGGFYGVFGGVSLLLFLPYLGAVSNFIGDFFLLGSGGAGLGVVTPLGPSVFGLTYWSALNSLLNALYFWVCNLDFGCFTCTALSPLSMLVIG